jgi:hypothetical protein
MAAIYTSADTRSPQKVLDFDTHTATATYGQIHGYEELGWADTGEGAHFFLNWLVTSTFDL